MKTNKERFLELVEKEPSPAIKKIKWRIRNRWWLKHWQRMHIKYLRFKRWYIKPKQR
jgi:hypothetical protein